MVASETIADMERDSKFGYGFLFMGASVPYLIEHLFGPTRALIVTVACAVAGVCFLWAGHNHRLRGQPPISSKRKACTALLAIAVIFAIGESSWQIYATHRSMATSPPSPSPPTIVINQTAKDSDCTNLVAGSDARITCETTEKERHAKDETHH